MPLPRRLGTLWGTLRAALPLRRGPRCQFQCNICSRRNHVPFARIGRELASCGGCGSTVRMRAVVHTLSLELFGESLPIECFPRRPDCTGIGFSDWFEYANRLANMTSYRNTYYHQEPRLDITAIPSDLEGTADFVICSDVLEHVAPPVSVAFCNLRKLLKPTGVAVLSVPYLAEGDTTIEHFPELFHWRLDRTADGYRLENTTRDGRRQVFSNVVMHGGDGATVEMRIFTRRSLIRELRYAGFTQITLHAAPEPRFGIHWPTPLSLMVSAKVR